MGAGAWLAMKSKMRRYLNAIDLGDMNYFYSWWGQSRGRYGRKPSKQEHIWNRRILELDRNGKTLLEL